MKSCWRSAVLLRTRLCDSHGTSAHWRNCGRACRRTTICASLATRTRGRSKGTWDHRQHCNLVSSEALDLRKQTGLTALLCLYRLLRTDDAKRRSEGASKCHTESLG